MQKKEEEVGSFVFMLKLIIWIVVIVVFNYIGESHRSKKAGRGKQKASKRKHSANPKKEKSGKAKEKTWDIPDRWEKEQKKSQRAEKKKQGKREGAPKKQEEKRYFPDRKIEQKKKTNPGNLSVQPLSGKYAEDGAKEPFCLEHYLDPLTAPFYPGNGSQEKKPGAFCADDYLFPALSPFYLELTDTGMDSGQFGPSAF